ncbi:hypothetical protein DQ04_01001040 [Trypanosoma grayi]|uniref:hypothetical protein n=1 Tax=Trypanosoma grayi TaxID=71804 RepID=UPI0004F45C40|nr:hypothetical protein DQ04_01001040 [Trypanosoma grayi]KEG13441.1 hypothetical protein DQ04_01001040 [Trypanosoma grayi]
MTCGEQWSCALLLFVMALGEVTVVASDPSIAVIDRNTVLAHVTGNWTVTWLTGQQERQTGFIVEVSSAAVVLREEAPLDAAVAVTKTLFRFLRMAEGGQDLHHSTCELDAWLQSISQTAGMQVSDGGIHFTGCNEVGWLPPPQHITETAFGVLLAEPHVVYLPTKKACALAPFAVRGYWVESLQEKKALAVLMLHEGGRDCTATFKLSKRSLSETKTRSLLGPAALLVLVALIKFLPRIYLKKKGQFKGGGGGFLNADSRPRFDARRQELRKRQEEIILQMKKQDGLLQSEES